MSDDSASCGCCAGTTTETPGAVHNAPGLPRITHRIGTHASFKASLLARLSSADFPRLRAGLSTRRDDDWTIGLLDAFATMGDVLTFYQERIANEAYLRTADERLSVLQLSRLVGYELAPGVAANTPLAFTLDVPLAPGAPPPLPVTIPVGTRVQSVPGPDELPQTFETVEAIVARPEWNALGVQVSAREQPYLGQTEAWLAGTATGLAPGDVIAIIGAGREGNPSSSVWEVRTLTRVTIDTARGLTGVAWQGGLAHFVERTAPQVDGARIYALRQRAGLFGSTAVDPNNINWSSVTGWSQVISDSFTSGTAVRPVAPFAWLNFALPAAGPLELDAVYPRITAGSWIAVTGSASADPALHGGICLYKVTQARAVSVAKFGIAGRVSRLALSPTLHLEKFDRRESAVYGQSEELVPGERPLLHPMFGSRLKLRTREPELVMKQPLALQGRRARLVAPADPFGISFVSDPPRVALPHESFIILAPPAGVSDPDDFDIGGTTPTTLRWRLLDRDGTEVLLEAGAGKMLFTPALESDALVDEVVTIGSAADAIVHDADRTTLRLMAPMLHVYDRASLRINANVAPATHGESVGESLGGGSAAESNQKFALRQKPLTYVSARNAKGRESTLTLRVNDIEWQQVPSLYAQPSTARVYALRQEDDGTTIVQFGDGHEGARLPTGADNVRATYRKGVGAAGNVRAGTLTSLLLRPMGVKAATNPLPAAGGEDPEPRDDARRSAPLTMLTLDRAVSVLDYADFARAFAGIAKAVGAWIPAGAARGMHITVAGAGGSPIPAGSETHSALLDSLRAYGDTLLPLTLQSYAPATFHLGAKITVKPEYDALQVLAQVEAALRQDFAFASREFGMPVTLDEVMASVHRVAGVAAVDVDALHRSGATPGPLPEPRIFPSPGSVRSDGTVTPAELLTLADDGLTLEVLP